MDREAERGICTLTPIADIDKSASLCAIVLAAGSSRRFGSDKRFALTAEGTSLIQATVSALAGHVNSVYIAIRSDDVIDDSWPKSSYGTAVGYVIAPRAEEGMGCSLADAVRQLPPTCNVMVALADMPFTGSQTIDSLVRHFRHSKKSAPIVFPLWVGAPAEDRLQGAEIRTSKRGHPVIFHQTYRAQLEALQGDQGANSIILQHSDALDPLDVEDRGVLLDIDRPADLPGPGLS